MKRPTALMRACHEVIERRLMQRLNPYQFLSCASEGNRPPSERIEACDQRACSQPARAQRLSHKLVTEFDRILNQLSPITNEGMEVSCPC